MRGKRARLIRRRVSVPMSALGYFERRPVIHQESATGKIRKFFTDLKNALKKPKAFEVTGNIYSPRATAYRQAKREWVRRTR
jgi:hypothetical protein